MCEGKNDDSKKRELISDSNSGGILIKYRIFTSSTKKNKLGLLFAPTLIHPFFPVDISSAQITIALLFVLSPIVD